MFDIRIIRGGTDIGIELRYMRDRIGPTANDAIARRAPEIEDAARNRALNLRMNRDGVGDRQLRRELAGAIYTRIEKQAVHIILNSDRMSRARRAMAFASLTRSFSHPTFGNVRASVTQSGDPGWFAKSIIEKAVRVVPPEIQRHLDRLAEHAK